MHYAFLDSCIQQEYCRIRFGSLFKCNSKCCTMSSSVMLNSYSCLFYFCKHCLLLNLTAPLNYLSRFWKRQLVVAKDARRVDILCSGIDLSHRLLDGMTCFKELHQIVEDEKAKLETEVAMF